MNGNPRRAAAVAGLLLASLGLRAIFAWLHPGAYDVDYYVSLGLSMLERGEYSLLPGIPTIAAPPLFPAWIAALFFVFGKHPYLILLANAVLSTATGGLLYLLGRRLFSRRAALAALALWTVYPYAIYYCAWTFRESLLVFLGVALCWRLFALFDRPAAGSAAACGVLGACLGLTNPSSFIFVGLAPLGLLLRQRLPAVFRLLLVYYACLAAAYSPWVIRNRLAFGRTIITNLHGGMNLYEGMMMEPEDFGTQRESAFRSSDPVMLEAASLEAAGREPEANVLLQRASRRIIRQSPGLYLRRCGQRFVKFWRFVPYRRSYDVSYGTLFWVSLLSDGILIPLALAGFWTVRRRWKEFLPLAALVLFWPLSYYLVYAVIRFRMPVMPAVVLFAAALLGRDPPA